MKAQIWDVAAPDKFPTPKINRLKGADGVVLIYDQSKYSSYSRIEEYWLKEVSEKACPEAKIVLFANKSDCPRDVKKEVIHMLNRRDSFWQRNSI